MLKLPREITQVATFSFLNFLNFYEFELMLLLSKRISLKSVGACKKNERYNGLLESPLSIKAYFG